MFDLIRNHKRWMLFLVLVLILPSFVFFGIEGYSRFMESDQPVARVAGETISRAQYDAARRQQLDRGRQMFGSAFDPAALDTPAMRRQILDQLINGMVLAQAVSDGYLTVSDNSVRQAIAQTPAVQTNGRFDAERYHQILASQGLTPAGFEAGLRYELSQALVLDPVAASGMASRELVESLLTALDRERTVRVAEYLVADRFDQVEVSDEDVQAYYEANPEQFQVPVMVDVAYVLLDSELALEGIEVNEADIEQYYEQNQARFTGETRRLLRHILIEPESGNDEAAAERAKTLAAELQADPQRFAEVAQAESDDSGSAREGGSLGWVSPGALLPEFDEVAFNIEPGTVSDPVRTDFGWHIIWVEDARDAELQPLEEVRDQLRDEIRMQLAGERFGEMASRFTEVVYDEADSLQPAASLLGTEVRVVEGVRRDGPPSDAPEAFDDPRVVQAVFDGEVLEAGRNSGVIELAPDRLIAVRAAEVHPAHLAPLEDVAGEIRNSLRRDRALALAREEGEADLALLREGELSANDLPFGEAFTVSLAEPSGMASSLLREVVAVSPEAELPQFVGAATSTAYRIASVQSIAEAEAPPAEAVAAEQSGLAQALGAAEADAVLVQLRRHYEVSYEPLADRLIEEGDGSGS